MVETMGNGERRMNPVTMTIINPRKEHWLSQGSNQPSPVSKSCTLPIELWGSRYTPEAGISGTLRESDEPFPKQALVFTCLQYKSFENTVRKEEIARNEQFLLFPQCFQPI